MNQNNAKSKVNDEVTKYLPLFSGTNFVYSISDHHQQPFIYQMVFRDRNHRMATRSISLKQHRARRNLLLSPNNSRTSVQENNDIFKDSKVNFSIQLLLFQSSSTAHLFIQSTRLKKNGIRGISQSSVLEYMLVFLGTLKYSINAILSTKSSKNRNKYYTLNL